MAPPKLEAETFSEAISIREISDDTFETVYNPEKMGNMARLAYGGYAIAAALLAAFQTLPSAGPAFHLYSQTGYYLGPASIDRKLICRVHRLRDTRTFATRSIEVSQAEDGGKPNRKVVTTTADFQVAEPASLIEYSAAPTRTYGGIDVQPLIEENFEGRAAAGEIPHAAVDAWKKNFGVGQRFVEQRPCMEGVFAQNVLGLVKAHKTTQDGLALVDKTSADWCRFRHKLPGEAERLAACLFLMDGALAFMPLSHNHQFMEDTSACSSLDFALRLFSNDVNMNEWHFREMTAVAAAAGRSYSEARLWDTDGKMVASMTQQCIMRPLKGSKI